MNFMENFEAQLQRSLTFYGGEQHQIDKAEEECLELALAISQKRCKPTKVTEEEIITEIADVLIMVHRLRHIFGTEKVDAEVQYKINRAEERMMLKQKAKEFEDSSLEITDAR